MKHILLLIFAYCTLPLSAQKVPKREFRGAWIQTVHQSEYSRMTSQEMQADFIRKLDRLQALGFNAVIFQIRPEADAWYPSDLEPWSRFCTGEQGKSPEPFFDPLAFLIRECHKRNLEFHAWLNPFRASTSGNTVLAKQHIYHQHPEWFVTYNNQLLFDPGLPPCRDFICQVVQDIVLRYDVDAIHMDDYFYPYPVTGQPFPDDKSFQKYGLPQGYTPAQRDDWRRENVNQLIRQLKRTLLATKPWVRLGISPFGIYRNQKATPDGSGSKTNGLQNYADLYADVALWVKKRWIDYNIPQIYWEIGHPAADYLTLAHWWDQNAHDIHLYIGQDVARTMKADQLTRKLRCERSLKHVQGHCFWPANEIFWNNKGIADSLAQHYHRYPALLPAYSHLYPHRPRKICNLQYHARELTWMVKDSAGALGSAHYFVIYRFAAGEKIDLNDPSKIVGITRQSKFSLPPQQKGEKYRFIVTSVDRFHNESKGKKIKVKR